MNPPCRSREGAWIEIHSSMMNSNPVTQVAPARECGLKFGSAAGAFTGGGRSREGAWIEIKD